jgi:hypothetical protein
LRVLPRRKACYSGDRTLRLGGFTGIRLRMRQRRAARFFDRAKRNRGYGTRNAGELAQPCEKVAQRGRRICANFEQMSVFTRDNVTFQNTGFHPGKILKCHLILFTRVVCDPNKRQQRLFDGFRVNRGQITADNALRPLTILPVGSGWLGIIASRDPGMGLN